MNCEKYLEKINFQLEDLGLSNCLPVSIAELGSLAGLQLLKSLVAHLLKLHRIDTNVDACSSHQEVYHLLVSTDRTEIRPYFMLGDDQTSNMLKLLHFTATLLQGKIMSQYQSNSSERYNVAGERGKYLFLIEKMASDLGITSELIDDEMNEIDILQRISNQVSTSLSSNQFQNMPLLCNVLGIDGSNLNSNQIALLQKIEDSLRKDFNVRRSMLLKRLDVTIQSFLWGEKAQGKENEIAAAINAQRKYLTEEPSKYTLNDVFNAPVSLMHEHTKKVTETSGKKKSLVKTIIIGAVPDRGGRANEMRPKDSDIHGGFKKYGGGGRGGGGGGGRGGGRHDHHNNGRDQKKSKNEKTIADSSRVVTAEKN